MSELLHNLIGTLQAAEKAQTQVRAIWRAMEKLNDSYRTPEGNSDSAIAASRIEFIQSVRAILKGEDQ